MRATECCPTIAPSISDTDLSFLPSMAPALCSALQAAKIVLTKHARTKKKAVTTINGLHFFSPPLPALKVISKGLASRLATGCSVSKSTSNPNIEEITIQGDVAEDVKEMILNRQKPFEALKQGDVGEAQVKVEEEKKKGKDKDAAAGGD